MDATAHGSIEGRAAGGLADVRDLLAEVLTLRAEVELLREDKRRLLTIVLELAQRAGPVDVERAKGQQRKAVAAA